jgi:hypothetical protein
LNAMHQAFTALPLGFGHRGFGGEHICTAGESSLRAVLMPRAKNVNRTVLPIWRASHDTASAVIRATVVWPTPCSCAIARRLLPAARSAWIAPTLPAATCSRNQRLPQMFRIRLSATAV